MKTLCIILITALFLSAQTAYRVLPDTKNNEIHLTVANESASTATGNIEVSLLKSPAVIIFSEKDGFLSELGAGAESEVRFRFDVLRSAPVNQKDTLELAISDSLGGFWTKTIILEYQPPQNFALEQNYPNPFNPLTTIRYQLPETAEVHLDIYDMLGRKVSTLVSRKQEAGFYEAQFDAAPLASGLYVYRLTAGSYSKALKMMVLK